MPGALGLLGGILGQEGRADEAIELPESAALAKQPHVGNWHLNLCALYRGKNMLDEALASGLEAIRTSPDTAAHRVELALTHLTRGERDLASLRYREALGREPENPAAHMGLGELLLSLGEYTPRLDGIRLAQQAGPGARHPAENDMPRSGTAWRCQAARCSWWPTRGSAT